MKTCLITTELMQLHNPHHDNIIDAKSNNSCKFLLLWPCGLAAEPLGAENIYKNIY